MKFIYEQYDLTFSTYDFFEYCFEPVLEFTSEFRTRNQRPHIQGDDFLVTQAGRYITCHNPLCQAFNNGCFTYAGFTYEDRVIFRSPIEHLHTATDFFVSADYRVELAFPRHL